MTAEVIGARRNGHEKHHLTYANPPLKPRPKSGPYEISYRRPIVTQVHLRSVNQTLYALDWHGARTGDVE